MLKIVLLLQALCVASPTVESIINAKSTHEIDQFENQVEQENILQLTCESQIKLKLWPWACKMIKGASFNLKCQNLRDQIKSKRELPPNPLRERLPKECQISIAEVEDILIYKEADR